MTLKLHTYEIIKSVAQQVKALSQERGFPLHGALWAEWGVGKSTACKQLVKDLPDVFYMKFPNRSVEPSHLIKEVLLALGVGPTRGYLQNYELLSRVLSARGLLNPILIIDESQYLLQRQTALSFFKDISEDLGFSYIFLGDPDLKTQLKAQGHSLLKRVRVKLSIPPITEETIYKLARFHGVSLNGEAYKVAESVGAVTMDVDFALYLAKKAGKQKLTDEEFKEFLIIAKRGE